MTAKTEFLWYIPNSVQAGHRGDDTADGWGTLDYSVDLAQQAEKHGWGGALIGTGWDRPDSFTVATAITALTSTFTPLVATRPGYWDPAHFASATSTLDRLGGGRLFINIVSGADDLAAYGDVETGKARRYARTGEFMRLVRRLWTEENVTFSGDFYRVENSSLHARPLGAEEGRHPRLYFGGASAAAEQVGATEADVQLFWGEPLDGVAERIDRLQSLSDSLGREHAPLEFGLRITTVVRDTADEAWGAAHDRLAVIADRPDDLRQADPAAAVGQRRLADLADRGDVLDSCLFTAPVKYGGAGAGSSWLVGSAADVAAALQKYADLGITHFVLSDTPYASEVVRIGDELLPLLRGTG